MNNERAKQGQGKLEILVLTLLTIYYASMFGVVMSAKWDTWILVYIGACVFIVWLLGLGKFRNIKARVFLYALLFEAAIIIFLIYSKNMSSSLIVFSAITVAFALFSIEPVIVTCFITTIIISILSFFVLHCVDFADSKAFTSAVFMSVNAAFICLLILFWVHMRNISQRNMANYIRDLKLAEMAKDDFIANVSHEIRTPINTISGISDIIAEEEDPAELKEDLNRIRIASRNLMLVVSDILDFSELEKGDIQLEEEVYDISSTINDIINLSTARNENEKVELIVNYDADLPRGLIGDEKKIRRALINIVGNALKFTESGCVVISVSHRREAYGVNLSFSVKDTGIGMNHEELEQLFKTYNQADASRSRAEGGIGLGLAITGALVQAMGGTISVYSEEGKGTEVKFVVAQKVSDSRPIIEIERPELVNAGIYFNMEQFLAAETRDAYAEAIANMQEQLKVKSTVCRNLAELKRRQASSSFTHLFITVKEYLEDSVYFDALAKTIKVVIIQDARVNAEIANSNICQVYKPLQLMPIAQAFNNNLVSGDSAEKKIKKFTTKNVRVLAVDDSEMNLRVISGLVKRYNIETIQVLSGAEALEKITAQDYDFVFMDHMMPEMDGVECLHKIRLLPGEYYKRVPIIALTANAVAGAREMLLKEGFDDFVEKPVELSVLERMLLRVLPTEKIVDLTEEGEDVATTNTPEAIPTPHVSNSQAVEGNYTMDSLDREKGYLYCGGEEAFDEILSAYAQKGKENYLSLQELFEQQDWKNYVIAIHAVKSSMKSIGANVLSEQARLLEMAGKEEDYAYIQAHHEQTYEMYKALIYDLMCHYDVKQQETTIDASSLEEISEEVMAECKAKMEEACFDLDAEAMLLALEPVRGYKYHDKPLEKSLQQIEQKIKMSDLMSAADMFQKL